MPWAESMRMDILAGVQQYHLEEHPVEIVRVGGAPFLELGELRQVAADGIIALVTEKSRDVFRRSRRPVVCLGELAHRGGMPAVYEDNMAAGRLGGQYLADRGFRSFGFVAAIGPLASTRREEGFRAFCAELGASFSRLAVDERKELYERNVARCAAWLKRLPLPCAIMAFNDHRARLTVDAALRCGLAVPSDLAVLGCGGNSSEALISEPHLSTIPIDRKRQGFEAVRLLHTWLNNGKRPADIVLPAGPVESRESTDVFATRDPRVNRMLSHIRRHACSGLRAADLLAAFPMARRTMDHLFQDVLGHSAMHEIMKVRLERAKFLLLDTVKPLSVVAESSGFTDDRHLIRVFKDKIGFTPTVFRQRGGSGQRTRA